MIRPTIFLDIDGPLNNERTAYAGQGFDPVALKAVDPENWTGEIIKPKPEKRSSFTPERADWA